jgi:hypothetical protein
MSRAVPDWERPLMTGTGGTFHPYQDRGAVVALPDRLRLVRNPDGMPEFRLALFRGFGAGPGLSGYGVLDFRLRAEYADRDTPFVPAPIARGSVRIRPADLAADLPAEIFVPQRLEWSGVGTARFLVRLSSDAAVLVHELLGSGLVPLRAVAEVEIEGVGATVPVTAHVDVRKLLSALTDLASGEALIPRGAIEVALAQDPATLGIAVNGERPQPDAPLVARALLDRLRWRLLDFEASPWKDEAPALRIPAWSSDVPSEMSWDLSEPVIVARPQRLDFDPFDEALQRVSPDAALVTQTTLPPLAVGFHRLMVESNLPAWRPDGAQLLATLRFPPSPPARMHEVSRTLALEPDRSIDHLEVRLAPGEKLAWRLSVMLIQPSASGGTRWVGDEAAGEGARVLVTPAQLPARIVTLEAGRTLLDLASITARLDAMDEGRSYSDVAVLSTGQPTSALVLPQSATDARLTITATPGGTGTALELGPLPVRDHYFDITDLPGYGEQDTEISIAFDLDVALIALETASADAESDSDVETTSFTPATPRRRVHWRCRDPFRCGLKWRWRALAEEAAWPWSAPVPLGRDLQLIASDRRRAA